MAGTIYVNSAYTADAELGEGKSWGINAFADFESALRAACTDITINRIEIESDLTEPDIEFTEYNDIAQKLTIGAAAGKEFTVDLGQHTYAVSSVAIRVMGDGASLTIEDGVKFVGFDVVADGFGTSNEEMIINGEVQALSLKVWTSNNGITVNETGKVILGYGDGQLDLAYGNGFLTVNGTLTDTSDGSLTDGPQFKAGYSGTRGNGNTLNLNNTYFEGGAKFNVNGSNGTFNLDNSVLKVSGGDTAGSLTIASSGNVINVDDGSRLIVANLTVGADNTVSVGDGSLEVTTLTNNGSITVSGDSMLTLGAYTGTGTLTIDLTSYSYTGRGGKIVDTSGVDWSGKYTVEGLAEDSKYSVIAENGDIVLSKKETPVELAADGNLYLSADGAVARAKNNGSPIGTEGADMTISTDGANVDVSHTADIKSNIVGKDITLENTKDLLIEEGKSISATGSATITNGKEVADDGAEATLTGEIQAGESIIFTNNGHADVDLDAKTIIVANNSKNTLTGSIGTDDTENVIVADGEAKADGVVVDGNGVVDGAIKDAIITADVIQIAGQELTGATTLDGWTLITGDSTFGNGDTVADTITAVDKTTKVVNGATLTIEKDATLNNAGYLLAGDCNYGLDYLDVSGDFDKAGGTIVIKGTVNTTQTNANGGGEITVAEGGVLKSGEVCVENGNIADAASGILSVDGTLNTSSLRVFNGGTVNVSGTVNADQTDYPIGTTGYTVIDVWGKGSSLNIDGTVNVKDDMKIQSGATLNITGGTLNVDYTLTNDGTVNVTGESTLDIAAASGNAIVLADGATLNNSVIKGGTGYTSVETNGYKYVLSVNGDNAGTLNFAGTNTIQNIEAGAGDIVNVKNATLNFVSGSDGFKLGNGATWNIENANVGGAWALSLDGAYMTDDENAPVSTLNAKGSTFTLQQISAKGTKDGQEIGYGTFNVNFADSEVNLSNRLQIMEQETATVNIKFAENSTLTAQQFYNFSTKGTVTFNASTAEFTQHFANIGKVNVENGAVLSVIYGSVQGSVLGDGGYAEKQNGNSGTITVNGGTMSLTSAGALSTFTNSGTIAVIGGAFSADSLTNDGTINVSGESDVKANVTGSGWIYMNGASLDSNTEITGANVRFADGESTLDGATINGPAFQVGFGGYHAKDERENVADIVVNVTNNSYIHTADFDYNGWVGTGWFESDADKAAAMTDARYTLNIENSVAEFGYFHVSTDGILNVTGNADEKKTYTGVSYSYYGGRTMINGVATFDNVDALVQYTNVSCDNGTETPGKLVIQNGANYVSWLDSSSTIDSFKISKTGIVEVDNATLDARHGTLLDTADATLTIKNNGVFKGNIVTNNGTITIDSTSLLKAEDITMGDSATITLNVAEDFSGYHKFIDLNAGDAYAGEDLNVNFDVDVEALCLTVIHSDDGDVALAKLDKSTLFVNSEWNTQDDVDAFFGTSNDPQLGSNAFSSMSETFKEAADGVLIQLMGDADAALPEATEVVKITTDGGSSNIDGKTVTVTGTSNTAERLWFDLNDESTEGVTTTLNIDAAKIAMAKIKAANGATANIVNSELDFIGIHSYCLYNKDFGVISIKDSTILNLVQLSAFGKSFTVDNSVLNGGSKNDIRSAMNVQNGSTFSLADAMITNGGTLTVDGSEMIRKKVRSEQDIAGTSIFDSRDHNGLEYYIGLGADTRLGGNSNGNAGNEGSYEGTGHIVIQNGATFDFSKALYEGVEGANTSESLIKIGEGSSITVDGTDAAVTFNADEVVNNGTFTISGESEVNAKLSGGNAVLIENAVLDGILNVAWREDELDDAGKVVYHTGSVIVEGTTELNGTINNVVQISQSGTAPSGTDESEYYSPYHYSGIAGKIVMGRTKAADVTINGVINGANVHLQQGVAKLTGNAGVYGTPEDIPSWMNQNVGGYTFTVGVHESLYDINDFADVTKGENAIAELTLESGAELARFGMVWVGFDQHDKGDNAYVLNINKDAKLYDFNNLTIRGDGTINVAGTVESFTTRTWEGSSANGTNWSETANNGGYCNNNGIMNVSETGYVKINGMNVGRKPAYGTAELNIDGGSVVFGRYGMNVGYATEREGLIKLTNGGTLKSEDHTISRYRNLGTAESVGTDTVNTAAAALSVGNGVKGTLEVLSGSTVQVGTATIGTSGTVTLDGTEETVTFKAGNVTNNGTFTVSGASLDITALTVAESATFSIGTVYAEGQKDIASTNTVNIDGFTGNITLTDDAVIAEGSEIRTTDGTIIVEDDATLYWDTVSGAAITVNDELAFEGFDFSKKTVYSGAVKWESTEQDLIINGANVVWDPAAAAAETADKTGTVIDAEGNLYNITVGANSITAEQKKTESGEDAKVEDLVLTLGAVAPGTESAYYTITVKAEAVGGSGKYEWSLVVDGEELTPDKYNYSDGKFTFDSKAYAADGKVDISVTVEDGYGTTDIKETAITLDKDAPTGKVTYSPSTWTNKDVVISITPEDLGGSGINSVYWVIGEESDLLTGDKGVYSLTVSGNTNGYFLVHDWAGNSSDKIAFDVQHIDKSDIVIGVTGYENGVWINKDVIFTVTATETDSTTSVYAVVGETQTKVENGSFTVSAEGESTVQFIANNEAGTTSESSEYEVKIDKVLPTFTDFSYKLQNGDIVVSYECSDDRSGVSKVEFYVDGEKAGESENAKGTFSFTPGNESTFYLAVSDVAGNVKESETETVKVSGGSSGGAGESQIVQDLHIGDHFSDEELQDMEDNYSILPEGESTVSVQKGYSAQAKGFGKQNGNGSNNISLAKGSSLEVYENIDNLGDVSIGKYGSLTVLSQKEGETLSGTNESQSVDVGKGAGLHVCGNLELKEGHDSLSSGKYGEIEICGNLDAGIGNDYIGLGKGSSLKAENVVFGDGDDALSTGKYSNIEISGDFKGGDDEGNDSIDLGKGSILKAGNMDFGAGDDVLSTGKYSNINIGDFNGGAGNDYIGLGKGSSLKAVNMDFGDGEDTFYIGKGSVVEFESITGLEYLYAEKGATLIGDFSGLEDVRGYWDSANLEDICGLLDNGNVSGTCNFANEWDVYSCKEEGKITISSDDDITVQVLSNGDWMDVALGVAFDAGSLVRISTNDQKDKEYTITATLA